MITNYEASAYTGDTIKLSITGLGSLSSLKKIYFSIKKSKADPDNKSIIQVEIGAGLKYIKAAVASTPANGSISIMDEDEGDILVFVHASESSKLLEGIYYCDVKVVENDSDVFTRLQGKFRFFTGITKAIS